MTKDEKGVWSLTVGPLTPDFYSYTFNVDGVRTVDPKNADDQAGHRQPGKHVPRPGRRGRVRVDQGRAARRGSLAWYRSGTLDALRRMHVYTPPGYESGTRKYPVLYLLHGGGDEDSGWSTIGRAGFILDNLIAAKKAVPMIVVMPNGSLPARRTCPLHTRLPRRRPRHRAAMESARPVHRRAAEGDRPVRREALPREDRPGEPGTRRSLDGRRPDLRGRHDPPGPVRLCGRSGARPLRRQCRRLGEANEAFLRAPITSIRWSSCSRSASATKTSPSTARRAWPRLLEKHGIKHEMHISGGGHTWINWRHYLTNSPKLFR